VAAELFAVPADASLCLAAMRLEHTWSQKRVSGPCKKNATLWSHKEKT
jgi:hypothetical protein